MEYEVNFKCILDNREEIPKEAIYKKKIKFPQVHSDGQAMAVLAKAIKENDKDVFAMVPFCLTVEAEALGADIKMGDEKTGPRVSNYVFKSINDLEKIELIDLTKNRISQVLNSVEILNREGEIVALSVQGPFTVMSSLVEPTVFYKAVRKNTDIAEKFMEVLVDSIANFIEEGVKRGANIISFGDSAGTLDIVGPKVYKDFSGKYSTEVLKRVYCKLGDSIIHLCGITSSSMDRAGFIKSEPIEVDSDMIYGDAIKWAIKERKDIKIIGHNCLKRSNKIAKNSAIWKITL